MSRSRNFVALSLLLFLLAALSSSEAAAFRTLSFEERVAAKEAIERVYYAERIGAAEPFEAAVPRAVLEEKVRTYLAQSVALEDRWASPVTAEALEREWRRIAGSTRFPGRLREVYRVLGDDPFLIQECFVRPVLVDRMARRFLAFDDQVHAGSRQEARRISENLRRGETAAVVAGAHRTMLEIRRADPAAAVSGEASTEIGSPLRRQVLELPDARFADRRARAPRRSGDVSSLRETRQEFSVEVLLWEEADRFEVAIHAVPKTDWRTWWDRSAHRFDFRSVMPAAVWSGEGLLPAAPEVAGGAPDCPPDDTWANGGLDDTLMPEERTGHTAVWTGTHMLIWGGNGTVEDHLGTGARYDPLTDAWADLSTAGAPAGRYRHTAIWTGQEMIVWGGYDDAETGTGGRYDPQTDMWTPMPTASARRYHTAVWTGSEMMVWGGTSSAGLTNTGDRYDPATDTWTSTNLFDAPAPRSAHSAVWTGSEMIVWGGSIQDTGGRYNPATDAWVPISTVGAPVARSYHTAVWSGTEMVVWGGLVGYQSHTSTGGRYDPATDAWSATAPGPSERAAHTAVWTGTRMIVWGGSDIYGRFNEGWRYDPAGNSWSPAATPNFLQGRSGHTAVWTGALMLIWGGHDEESERLDNGGRYDPAADTWTPTFTTAIPSARSGHSAVWTGNLMIVWGGYSVGERRSGSRYDPLTDSWTSTSLVDAPPGRSLHTAVWTGSEMVIWGGDFDANINTDRTGGRYNPLTDTWRPTNRVTSPTSRYYHSAVWTGTEMIVWAGVELYGSYPNTGGRYNPVSDTWTDTSTINTPSIRREHTAVWTGEVMIVWGGEDGTRGAFTGGRYDPETDTWLPTSLVDVPEGRNNHTAIWSGTEMIVWGGAQYSYREVGGRYDPVLDRWTAFSTAGQPANRSHHTAVWTGREMIVWAGWEESTGLGNTGGRYHPATDSWELLSPAGAPEGRYRHTAVWTGNSMVIWGGLGTGLLSNGGRYYLGNTSDIDQDGYTVCDLDCDDLDPGIFPGAPEVCDGADSNCDGTLPPEEADEDGDGVVVCADDCDDQDPLRFPGNVEICDFVDNDCDGAWSDHPTFCGVGECLATGTCVNGFDSCVPLPPSSEMCDGLDNDCDGALPLDERDLDRDSWMPCGGDCDDTDVRSYPGAPEANDGIDNQCLGPAGLVDEISGVAGFFDASDASVFSWSAQEGAMAYEVSRSEEADLSGGCRRFRTTEPILVDLDEPPLGVIFHYLVQSTAPFAGSFGFLRDTSEAERTLVCGAENDCDDGLDEDADGRIDCADPNCLAKEGCDAVSAAFTDTTVNDVPSAWLLDSLGQSFAQPTDYLLFRIAEGGVPLFSWCAERADFYADSYVSLALAGGSALSGGWNRWHRSGAGAWTGPVTEPFENWYGSYCAEDYSWCSEVGLGGHILGVAPWETGICEIFDDITCGGGGWELTLTLGVSRLEACGF